MQTRLSKYNDCFDWIRSICTYSLFKISSVTGVKMGKIRQKSYYFSGTLLKERNIRNKAVGRKISPCELSSLVCSLVALSATGTQRGKEFDPPDWYLQSHLRRDSQPWNQFFDPTSASVCVFVTSFSTAPTFTFSRVACLP